MKKMMALIMCMVLTFNFKVFAADSPEIQAVVSGTVDAGQNIQILVNIKDIKSFYAGQVDFKYDASVLKIISIEQGDLIKQSGVNKFDAINKIDLEKGIATYAFSCLGNINGFSGSGTFVKINAQVLKKDSFHVRSKPFLKQPDDDNNLRLQIIDGSSDLKEIDYAFIPYEFNANSGTTVPANTVDNNTKTSTSGSQTPVVSPKTDTNSTANGNSKVDNSGTVKTENPDTSNNKASENKTEDIKVQDKKADAESEKQTVDNAQKERINNIKLYGTLAVLLLLFGGLCCYIILKRKSKKINL